MRSIQRSSVQRFQRTCDIPVYVELNAVKKPNVSFQVIWSTIKCKDDDILERVDEMEEGNYIYRKIAAEWALFEIGWLSYLGVQCDWVSFWNGVNGALPVRRT